ncbi:hypothetical protein [Mesorhizobium sp. LNHC221B00]|uniref:hypothetical protein n=1 Tax=Mesorhizobium sp. LNHC221B00 TaxID=1287233 RepID=UPI0012EB7BF3|nr:hypothetical protein [Mesorhizobium sp. LNHC221B00]
MAADRAEIRRASKRVLKAVEGMHPVDAMAALETVVMNMVADLARDLDDANRGLDAVVGDLRIGLQMRFPGTMQ